MPKTVEIWTATLFCLSPWWLVFERSSLGDSSFLPKNLVDGTVVAVLNYCRRGWGVWTGLVYGLRQ